MGEVMLAARVDDGINHTYRKLAVVVGTTVGIGVGLGIAYLTRGKAHGVVRTLGRGAQEGGGLIGVFNWLTTMASDAIGGVPAGSIEDGARRTWTESQRSARITDPAECADPAGTQLLGLIPPFTILTIIDGIGNMVRGGWPGEHVDAKIEQGSETVFIENRNAARLSEKTTCEGKIATAARRTWIGGPSVTLAGFEGGSEEGRTIGNFVYGVEWTFNLVGRVMDYVGQDPVKIALGLSRTGLRAWGEQDPALKPYLDRISNGLEWAGLAYDLRPSSTNTRRQNGIKTVTNLASGARSWFGQQPPATPPTRIVSY